MDRLDDDSLLARLPRRSDDEPPNLRQDLLDEVRDYLQSAWEEEQRLTPDPQQAWQLVLQRFGDPAQLVRKLWFDALKEQIMSRRLILAAFGLAAVMFVAFAAINLRMLSALETTLAGAQQTNALLVEKLEALQAAPKTIDDASMTWRRLRLKLVAEDESPVEGTVGLIGHPYGETGPIVRGSPPAVTRQIGSNGLVEFGLVRIGLYGLEVNLKNGYSCQIHGVRVRPGEDLLLPVTCPIRSHHERDQQVRVGFTPPPIKPSPGDSAAKTLEPDSLWLLCRFFGGAVRIGDTCWMDSKKAPVQITVIVNSHGEAFEVDWLDDSQITDAELKRPGTHELENLRSRPWNGMIPVRGSWNVLTELLQLQHEDSARDLAVFAPVFPFNVDVADASEEDYAAFDLSALTGPSSVPVTWNVPVTTDSVNGRLLHYSDIRGMGSMYGGQ